MSSRPSGLIARIVFAILCGLPATLLAPPAAWLLCTSILQLLTSFWKAACMATLSVAGLTGVVAVWTYIIHGALPGRSGIQQASALIFGALVMGLVGWVQTTNGLESTTVVWIEAGVFICACLSAVIAAAHILLRIASSHPHGGEIQQNG
ncbi:MAG: hypothetical protein GC164_09625 [Phycisphaera sp.]|nr:hypothetical protein [Phycisphaera sp.]